MPEGTSKKRPTYTMVWSRERQRLIGEHRVVAEKLIGRKIKKKECVHHINGIGTDNRPENLMVMTKGNHSRLHKFQEIINRRREKA